MPHACRLFVVLTLGSVGLLTLAGCVPISAQSQDKTLVETVSLEPNGRLALEAERGSVRLTSWDNNSSRGGGGPRTGVTLTRGGLILTHR
jgi:hypothetical protein